MTFAGFPVAALDFYDDLEVDNSKSFWQEHREVYESSVRAPMTALCALLEPEFGAAKVFRPYRDVRFAKDKTPYKTHQGAFVGVRRRLGWYAEVSPRGVRVGGGFYGSEPPELAAVREAMADDTTGPLLRRRLTQLEKAGFEVSGDRLKTTPRGYDAHHPRLDLLRHRTLFVGRSYGFEPLIHTPELADAVRDDWRRVRPLVSWLDNAMADAVYPTG